MAEDENSVTPSPGAVINPGSDERVLKDDKSSNNESTPAENNGKQAEDPDNLTSESSEIQPGSSSLTWEAPEFVAHEKTALWYLSLLVGAAAVSVLLYFVTRDLITAGVVIVAALLLAINGAHKPKLINYSLDGAGISIGNKRYAYEDFRSFSPANEINMSGIVLMPLKRFSPPQRLYFAGDKEEAVTNYLADRLPIEPRPPDMTDRFMRRIKF